MRKKFVMIASLLSSFLTTPGLFANAVAHDDSLQSFEAIRLGASYDEIQKAGACDKAEDAPGLRGSMAFGLTTAICPASQTFAMATLLDSQVVSLVVNWVSWNQGELLKDRSLIKIPSSLRRDYGLPSATIAYEAQFGNKDSDRVCSETGKLCQIHIWKTNNPERIASLVYARNGEDEVPLLFQMSDIKAEKAVKNRVREHSGRNGIAVKPGHAKAL